MLSIRHAHTGYDMTEQGKFGAETNIKLEKRLGETGAHGQVVMNHATNQKGRYGLQQMKSRNIWKQQRQPARDVESVHCLRKLHDDR